MNTKKIIIAVLILLIIPLLWYTLSPIWNVVELDEPLPGTTKENDIAMPKPLPIEDNLDRMSVEERAAFQKAMDEMREKTITMDDAMDALMMPETFAQGIFTARAHEVKGRALLIKHDGTTTLRFEDFETINGPELHIYLSTDLSIKDYVDLGNIRATKGNVNYEVPPVIDLNKYRNVLVWCEPFGVLFSYAELK